MKSAFASVVGVTALLSGCASSEAFVSRAVRKSQAYAEVMARSSHTTFVIEEKHPDYAIEPNPEGCVSLAETRPLLNKPGCGGR
jgi:hypothetical protein